MSTSAAFDETTPHSLLASLADATRTQMVKILEDDLFLGSPRLSKLFRFVVEMSLEGKGHYLKEYTIAVDLFRRPESFDSRLDSIVRVEAARLRKKLNEFARTNGREDFLVLRLPPSGYEPIISFRHCHSRLTPVLPTIGIFEGKDVAPGNWTGWLDRNVANFVPLSKPSLRRLDAEYDLILVLAGKNETFQDYVWLLGLLSKRSKGIFLISSSEPAESILLLKKALQVLIRDLSSHLPSFNLRPTMLRSADHNINSVA